MTQQVVFAYHIQSGQVYLVYKEYADEEIKYFLYHTPLKIMDILLFEFMVSSLYVEGREE